MYIKIDHEIVAFFFLSGCVFLLSLNKKQNLPNSFAIFFLGGGGWVTRTTIFFFYLEGGLGLSSLSKGITVSALRTVKCKCSHEGTINKLHPHNTQFVYICTHSKNGVLRTTKNIR